MFESEERQIAERIKDCIKKRGLAIPPYIMLRNGNILDIDDYRKMVDSGKITPQDAYIFIYTEWVISKTNFYYPFLFRGIFSLVAFLSKLHFRYGHSIVPASGLKYIAFAVRYKAYLSIEVSSLDTVVNNTNLRKIVAEVIGGKIISGEKVLTDEEYKKISDIYESQRLFAGHNPNEAWSIIFKYYDEDKKSLAKEAARIAMDYNRILNPYTICYDTRTWKEVDCWSIKLD